MEVEDQPPPAQEADMMASTDSNSDMMNVDVDSISGGGDGEAAAAPSGPPPRLMISKMVRFDVGC